MLPPLAAAADRGLGLFALAAVIAITHALEHAEAFRVMCRAWTIC